MWYLKKKKQEEWKPDEDDNIKQNVAVLDITMNLRDQKFRGSHIDFGQLRLESQILTLLRHQNYISVFRHFLSVYTSSQLL